MVMPYYIDEVFDFEYDSYSLKKALISVGCGWFRVDSSMSIRFGDRCLFC